jgi:hypothetical protein
MLKFLVLESDHGGTMWHFDLRFNNIIDIGFSLSSHPIRSTLLLHPLMAISGLLSSLLTAAHELCVR